MKNAWTRVSTTRPCAVCGKPDWCGFTADGLICCMRVASYRQAGNGGWFHGGQLHFGDARPRMPYKPSEPDPAPTPALDADLWLQAARRAWDEPKMTTWAERLGLDVRVMDALGAYRFASHGRSRLAFDQARVEFPGLRWCWNGELVGRGVRSTPSSHQTKATTSPSWTELKRGYFIRPCLSRSIRSWSKRDSLTCHIFKWLERSFDHA